MENISVSPPFASNFVRDDVPRLTREEKRRLGAIKSKAVERKRSKISRYTLFYCRTYAIPLEEFDINQVHLNKIWEEDPRGNWLFELLYGPHHNLIFIETEGTNSRLIRKIEGDGKYCGLYMDLQYHEPSLCRILDALSSEEFIERISLDTSIVTYRPFEYSVSQLKLSLDEENEYSGNIKVKLEHANQDFYTPAYDIDQFDNPNYNTAIKSKDCGDYVDNYKIGDRFNIKAIIHFSYITCNTRKINLIPFVKEFGYSRM